MNKQEILYNEHLNALTKLNDSDDQYVVVLDNDCNVLVDLPHLLKTGEARLERRIERYTTPFLITKEDADIVNNFINVDCVLVAFYHLSMIDKLSPFIDN